MTNEVASLIIGLVAGFILATAILPGVKARNSLLKLEGSIVALVLSVLLLAWVVAA
jgi:hypothetical protein